MAGKTPDGGSVLERVWVAASHRSGAWRERHSAESDGNGALFSHAAKTWAREQSWRQSEDGACDAHRTTTYKQSPPDFCRR